MYRLTSEVSSQGFMLAAHQQQLIKLTSQTKELVRSMQALTTQAATPVSLAAPPAQPSQGVTSPRSNPHLSLP